MRRIFKDIPFEDLFSIISEMRVIKEDWEIGRMRKAIDVTRLGIEEMMKKCRPKMMEYEIEANYDYVLKKNGITDKAFQTIAASGMNGTTLHYVRNNCQTGENDLILIDAGAQYKWYNGDISRTFPVSGKFTEKQKEIYNIVLRGQQLIIDNIKPGVLYSDLNEMLKDYYFEELKKIGLVKTKADVFEYYFHNVSHFIGAETHDVGDRGQRLKKGMVISVEPGLYIKELGIGIRIEDDALVTDDGCEILTKDMIKTVDDIEKFMAEENENARI
jgi:Xaa-Pro aminopeptidase